MGETVPYPVNNLFYFEWALPGALALFIIAIVQAAYVVLAKKQQTVIAHYLAIREILAGTFRRALAEEVRAVFRLIEDQLPSILIRGGPGRADRSRFEMLAENLETDPEDPTARHLSQKVLRDAMAGVLVDRIDSVLARAERAPDGGEAPTMGDANFHIFFSESTVDDLVYLARALHLTRKHQHRFYQGRVWARRFLYVLVPSYIALIISMLFNTTWAHWVGVGSLILFILGALGSGMGSLVAIRAGYWLEEKAEAPDTEELFRSELEHA